MGGAVRAATRLTLDELSGDWRDLLRPFARDFLIPRAATDRVLAAFRGSRRLVVVEGAPLAGKSSVLRDVAERTAAGDEFGTLLVDAGRGGAGIFRSLAEILADTLGWFAGLNAGDMEGLLALFAPHMRIRPPLVASTGTCSP